MTHHHASWSELGNLKKGRTSFASAVSARMEIPFSCKIAVTVFGKGKSHRLPKQRNFTTKTSESTGNTTSTYRTSIRLIRSIYWNSLMLLLEHLHQKFTQKLDGGSSTFTFFSTKKPRGKASTIYIYIIPFQEGLDFWPSIQNPYPDPTQWDWCIYLHVSPKRR